MSTSRKDGRRPPAGAAGRPPIDKPRFAGKPKYAGKPDHAGKPPYAGKPKFAGKPKAHRGKPAVPKPAADGDRIAKVMARAGLCSRRDAEVWIAAGRVALNGTVLTSPAIDVRAGDAVLVDGQPLAPRERTRLFLFNKPRGLVTTDRDPEGRATVFDHLRTHWPDGPRVVTVGRLDINTEGLLLLTNDGGLARVLELPATGWLRRYRVRANGTVDQAALDGLKAGVTLDGIDYAGVEATLDRVQGANVWLTVALREGKNREVKRLLEHVGLFVNRLIRISFGPFQLGTLGDGKVEEVRTRVLRDQLGQTLAAEANADFTSPLAAPPAAAVVEAPRRDRPPRPAHPGKTHRDERARAAPPARGRERPQPDARKPRFEAHEPAAPAPRRDRPQTGPRKHVSALRAEAADAQAGARRRTERSETADRKGRAIVVERKVAARPKSAEPARPPRAKRHQWPAEAERSPRGKAPAKAKRFEGARGRPAPQKPGDRKSSRPRDGERPRPRR